MAQKHQLRSGAGHQLVVPLYHLNSCGLRAFSVLGPRLWNSLPVLLRDTSHNTTNFGHSLKTFSLSRVPVHRVHRLWRLRAIQIYVLLTCLPTALSGQVFGWPGRFLGLTFTWPNSKAVIYDILNDHGANITY